MIDPNKENKKDFFDFMNLDKTNPPEELSSKVLSYVKNDLNPSHKKVFGKFFIIQALIGFLTLIFCPQFDLSLTNNYELFHFFHHKFGENICMVLCGSIFIGSGAIFTAYILKASEIRKIKELRFSYYLSISIIALLIFFLLGSQVYLNLAVLWIIGASIGGLIAFEINHIIRKDILDY